MRTRSAVDAARSFCIAAARCSFTVRSTIPRSKAICLLSCPRTTRSQTSRSRSLSVAASARRSAISSRSRRATASRAIAASNGRHQRVGHHGLLQEVAGAVLHRVHARRHVAVSGEEDHGRRALPGRQQVLQFEPARSRQPQVQQDAAGGAGPGRLEELLCAGVARHGVAGAAEQPRERRPHRIRRRRPRGQPTGASCRRCLSRRGRQREHHFERRRPAAAPRSGVPPYASAMPRQMARPIPRPSGFVVTNGSNARAATASAIPGTVVAHAQLHPAVARGRGQRDPPLAVHA